MAKSHAADEGPATVWLIWGDECTAPSGVNSRNHRARAP
jgi:hypothetical protein